MRSRVLVISLLGMALLASTGARAGQWLLDATWFQVVQGFPMTRTFGQLGATGNSSGTSIAVNLSYPPFLTSFFVPKTANGVIDLHVKITQGGPQAITATPSMAMGSPGIPGNVTVMDAVHLGMGAGSASMFNIGMATLVKVPVSIGEKGTFTGSFTVLGIEHYITVDFYAWTPHTLKFTGLTTKGKALPNVTAAGTFFLTPSGFGTVALVSPSRISIDCALAQRRTVSFTTLRLFFPEPRAWLLLAGSALALAYSARRGRR